MEIIEGSQQAAHQRSRLVAEQKNSGSNKITSPRRIKHAGLVLFLVIFLGELNLYVSGWRMIWMVYFRNGANILNDFARHAYELFFTSISPFYSLFEIIPSLFRGDLFPIVMRFGYTCGPIDTINLGNGPEWSIISVCILLVSLKLVLHKPKNNWAFFLLLYTLIYVTQIVSIVISIKPQTPCL